MWTGMWVRLWIGLGIQNASEDTTRFRFCSSLSDLDGLDELDDISSANLVNDGPSR